jgi:hypothetical protein
MLQIRYHPKFKVSKDTLLLAGNRDDIDRLRLFFLNWNGEDIDLIKYLQTQEDIYLSSVTELHLKRAIKESDFIWKNGRGIWTISKSYQEDIIGRFDGLLEANDSGHQYLDYDRPAPVQIMVSKDEYPLPGEYKIPWNS